MRRRRNVQRLTPDEADVDMWFVVIFFVLVPILWELFTLVTQ